jgi:hypothetical protein
MTQLKKKKKTTTTTMMTTTTKTRKATMQTQSLSMEKNWFQLKGKSNHKTDE